MCAPCAVSVRPTCVINGRNLLLLSPRFSLNGSNYRIWLFVMDDWVVMAEVVGRKLVENGQERILQPIFDGGGSTNVMSVIIRWQRIDRIIRKAEFFI